MNTLILDYNGLALHASREAWFNATEIAEYHGKRLDVFFKMKRTQQYIQAVAKQKGLIPCNPSDLNPTNQWELNPFDPADYPELIRTKRGRYGGTWLHPDLMVCFARFISLEFEIWCDQTIKALLIDGKDWQGARSEAATGHRLMAAVIHETALAAGHQASRFDYINESKRINRALTGKWAGLDRNALSAAQLRTLSQLEVKNAALYMMGRPPAERDRELSAIARPALADGIQAA